MNKVKLNDWQRSVIRDYLYRYCDFSMYSKEIQDKQNEYLKNLKDEYNELKNS